ncbi:erythromycin esterase family protein [Caldimonas tepidiphila]|uniref:erythromycin esterase family protein n=1 Tax=Caldimonas tepidiphila TaxID=2315841 RepID=UPI000E5BEEF9|nr:erythromycin esterase family protein [Caldimonas tepidiphila]
MSARTDAIEAVRRAARPLRSAADLGFVVEAIGDAETILLGEASHGTREFYRLRALITQRLIESGRCDAIAVEADWPDALQVSRHVQRGRGGPEALQCFERFPRWMWRNREVERLVQWLAAHNASRGGEGRAPVGFFGIDLYSLRGSMDAVLRFLAQADPEGAKRARERYACFDHLAEDAQRYGYAATFGLRPSCEEQAVQQLTELLGRAAEHFRHDGSADDDELFYAQQNARVVRNAEAYYRAMFQGRVSSWNLRDTHMADTLLALREHLGARLGRAPRIVVWAHNSHLGDARATEMGEGGEINVGQLVRERRAELGRSYLLGFTTHTGSVTAAHDWDEPPQHMKVRPSHLDSHERLLHDALAADFWLPLDGQSEVRDALHMQLLERAIGVIYRPDSERVSHYFHADLPRQFDALIHVDETHAVAPLDPPCDWPHEDEKVPETYPSGL